MQLIGPWVAVEPLNRVRHGSIHLPFLRPADVAFAALVLAVGDEVEADGPVPFGVDDIVLVELLSGHPFMANEEPMKVRADGARIYGRTRPVDLRCDAFGGSPDKTVGLVPWNREALPVCQHDEEAARRIRRCDYLSTAARDGRRTITDEAADKTVLDEYKRHKAWLESYERHREGRRRTMLTKPTLDAATGGGILAVFGSIEEVVATGVDVDHLLGLLERRGVV